MTAAITVRFANAAKRLIDRTIETPNATWISLANDTVSDTDEPWKVTKGTKTETPVKIVFYPDELEDRQLFRYLKGSSQTVGNINGIMYPSGFTPSLKDVVKFEGKEFRVTAIDPIQPVDQVIVYLLEFSK